MMPTGYMLLFFMLGLKISTPFDDKVARVLAGEVPVNFPWERHNSRIITSICQNKSYFMDAYLKNSSEDDLKKIITEKEKHLDDNEKKIDLAFNDKYMIFIYKLVHSPLREMYAQKMIVESSKQNLVVPITDCGKAESFTYFITERYFSLNECIRDIIALKPVEQLQLFIKLLEAYRDINKQKIAHNAVNPNFIFFKTKSNNDLLNPRVGFFGSAWIKCDREYSKILTLEEPQLHPINLRNAEVSSASSVNGVQTSDNIPNQNLLLPLLITPSQTHRQRVFLLNLEYKAVVGLITIVHMRILNNSNSLDAYFNEYKGNPDGFYKRYCPTDASAGLLGIICYLRTNSFRGEDPYYYENIIATFEAYKRTL